MDQDTALRHLYDFGFPARYYAICDDHPKRPIDAAALSGTRDEVTALFRAAGKEVTYISDGRIFRFEDIHRGLTLSASLMMMRGGLEYTYGITRGEEGFRSNLASLARAIILAHSPDLARTPPFPRPFHANDPNELAEIIAKFVALIDDASAFVAARAT